MEEEPRTHLAAPILLVLLGVALLLSQLGIWQIPWSQLWRWWPLLLVIIGLDVILSRTRIGQILFLAIVILAVGIVLAVAPSRWLVRAERLVTQSYSHALDGATSARVHLELAMGRLELGALDDSGNLFEADVRYDERRGRFLSDVERTGDELQVELRSEFRGWGPFPGEAADRWEVRLNPDVPLRLDVDGGINRSQLDLSQLDLTRLDLNVGVGDVALSLPEGSVYRARVDGGVGRLEIRAPQEGAVRIDVDGGLGSVDVAERFRRDGNSYLSEDYRSGEEAIEIDINAGIGALIIR
ncbi:MAG: hypothetical protein JXA74_00980 [Anaerolineae bacterium]|nr:hypothetical protein [Anaerolineae bacterium]